MGTKLNGFVGVHLRALSKEEHKVPNTVKALNFVWDLFCEFRV